MQHLPSLSILRTFEAAAKHQSFTLAAEELHLTQGAVSRQVRELEAQLGLRLFRHEGRGVALTEAGHGLARRLGGDLERLRATLRHAEAAGDGGQVLSIAVLPTFGARWLAPRLGRFRARHPEVELVLSSRTEPFDMVAASVDLAIHFGRADWVKGTLAPLCPEDLLVVAAPPLVATHDLTAPDALPHGPLLHLSSRAEAWADHLSSLGLDTSRARQGMQFDQFSMLIAAALHGLGAAIVPSYLIEEELQAGTLISLGQAPRTERMYYTVMPQGQPNPLAQAFRDWVSAEAATSSRARRSL